MTPAARLSKSSSLACSRPTRQRSRSRSCSVTPKRISSRSQINTSFAHCTGGGFGGRDHTPFPLYAALAAAFFPNRPVRLANNRFEQFQSGIKRHAFKIRSRIEVDRATGKIFLGFAADHVLDGGGLANFSGIVASVAAIAALGAYYAPK